MKALAVCLNPTFQITMNYNKPILQGEVNRATSHLLDASGKGMNVARVLIQLNHEASYFTHLGGPSAAEFLTLAAKDNVNIIYGKTGSSIRSCITILESSLSRTTELVQEPESVTENTEKVLRKLYIENLNDFDIIIFSGTKAPGYSSDLIPDMVRMAKEQNKIVILDIKGQDLKKSLKYKPDYIKPNLSEFYATFSDDRIITEQSENLDIKPQTENICRLLSEKYDTKTIITRGKYPVWYFDGNEMGEIPVMKIKPVNTIGCGDAFTAGLAAGIMEGKNLLQCLQKSVECSAKVAMCIRPGSLFSPSTKL